MGNDVARSNTHVANATGRDLCVFYSTDKMVIDEIIYEAFSEAGGKISASAAEAHFKGGNNVKVTLRRDTRIRSVHLPPNDFVKIVGEGNLYISIFFEQPGNKGEFVCHNYFIPIDRSIIVTGNRSVKWQKYGGSLWEDEYGNLYK